MSDGTATFDDDNTATFDFDVTLDDLLYCGGLEGLNEILDERLDQNSDGSEPVMATDITYEVVSATPGIDGIITIRATFTPDPL